MSSYIAAHGPTGSPARHRDSGHHRGGDAVDADAWAKRAPTLGNRSAGFLDMDVYLSQNARPPQTTTVKSPEISAEAEEEPSPTHCATTARSENFRKQLDNAGIVNMEMLKKMVMSTVLTVCSLYWADSGMRLRLTRAQEAALEPLTAATPSTAPARMTHQRRVRGRQARPVSKERAALAEHQTAPLRAARSSQRR